MRFLTSISLGAVLVFGLTACMEEDVAELPPPAPLTIEATGYYCNMTITDHQGPKGQVRLKSLKKPLWFSSVRDTVAFTLLPEEPKDITVIYVTDMSKPDAWENPDNRDWVDAHAAHFVIGSSRKGGMGAAEPVPFISRQAAEDFARQYGGKIFAFTEIPESAGLGTFEIGSNNGNKEIGG